MTLTIKNVGIIADSSIDIEGITVVGGENDTGKSTISRALYAVFSAFHNIQTRIMKERTDNIEKLLDRFFTEDNRVDFFSLGFDGSSLAESIVTESEHELQMNKRALTKFLRPKLEEIYEDELDEGKYDELCTKIIEVLHIPQATLINTLAAKALLAEFSGQITNTECDDNAEIALEVKESKIVIHVRGDAVFHAENALNLRTEAIYIDDPFILDDLTPAKRFYSTFYTYKSHKDRLRELLIFQRNNSNVVTEIIANERLQRILEKISFVCEGDIVQQRALGFGYRKSDNKKAITIGNLSTGIKAFAILKMLLIRGLLEENGTIILDEPEIHLHPEWQLQFAELIVLLHKEFGMHILLNTHSPYFLRAIQVYARENGVADKCRYYMAERNGDISRIRDVTDRVEVIYERLARPLQKLEDLRWTDV